MEDDMGYNFVQIEAIPNHPWTKQRHQPTIAPLIRWSRCFACVIFVEMIFLLGFPFKKQQTTNCEEEYRAIPASSKWPFDLPNGGHLALEKVT